MSEMLPLQQERKFSKKKVTPDISESQATYTPAMSKSLKTPFNAGCLSVLIGNNLIFTLITVTSKVNDESNNLKKLFEILQNHDLDD